MESSAVLSTEEQPVLEKGLFKSRFIMAHHPIRGLEYPVIRTTGGSQARHRRFDGAMNLGSPRTADMAEECETKSSNTP